MKNVEVSLDKIKLKKLLAVSVAFATCFTLCGTSFIHANDEETKVNAVAASADASGDVDYDASGDASGDVDIDASGDASGDVDVDASGDASGDASKDDIKDTAAGGDGSYSATADLSTEDVVDFIKEENVKEPTINVEKNDQTVKKEIFKAAKDASKPIVINVVNEEKGLNYSFKFAAIENENVDMNLDLTISKVDKALDVVIPSNVQALEFNFAHHGNLPGKATVSAKVKGISDGNAYLYYLNEETGKLELISNKVTIKDGVVTFEIEHCSKYVVTKEALKVEEDKATDDKKTPDTEKTPETDKTPKDKDKNNGAVKDTSKTTTNAVPALALMAMLAGAGVIVLRKKEN